jgi:negative regulator of sigma E activity
MKKKTQGVYEFVQDVLRTLDEPYGEDITEDVFLAIEENPQWKQRYDDLGAELHSTVVNNWIGRYTKAIAGMETIKQVDAKRSKLITSYTKLRH